MIVYVGFCGVAVRVLMGTKGNEPAAQRHAAASVLNWPAGHVIVIAAGAGLIAISAYQVYTAVRGQFTEDNKLGGMSPEERTAFLIAGRVGLSARAIVVAIARYFLIRAAIDARPANAAGIDTALAQVHHQPFGARCCSSSPPGCSCSRRSHCSKPVISGYESAGG